MNRVILARHGESEFSVRGALNGDLAVRVGLTAAGREQARRLGDALRPEQLDLVVTTEFERVRATADEALAGRDVPRVVLAELNDPRYGDFEGRTLEEFRAWAVGTTSADVPGPNGESRQEIVERYARGFRIILARPEQTILVVAHSLPLSYALAAREGREPSGRMPLVEYATPYPFGAAELEQVVQLLERWLAAPTW